MLVVAPAFTTLELTALIPTTEKLFVLPAPGPACFNRNELQTVCLCRSDCISSVSKFSYCASLRLRSEPLLNFCVCCIDIVSGLSILAKLVTYSFIEWFV